VKPAPTTGVERLWRAPLFSLGAVLLTIAAFMGVTGLFAAAEKENPEGCLVGAVFSLFIGGALVVTMRRGRDQPPARLSLRSAFLFTVLGWLVMPVFATVPLMMGPKPLSFTDAYFEVVSGLTTTGATVIVGLDSYPRSLLLWRSLLTGVGGIGIILMAVLLLPSLRVGGMQVFMLESSERSVDRLVPQTRSLVLWITGVYVGLIAACAVCYAAAGMSAFDAVNQAMPTIATGGLATHDASFGVYVSHPAILWVGAVFMMAGALPFMAYIKMMRGRISDVLGDSQIKLFVGGVAALIFVAHLVRWRQLGDDVDGTLSHTAFNIVSIVTTTGFTTEDYQLWGPGFVGLFFVLTFFGGCAGSTTGGIKIYRFQLLFLIARDYLRRLYDPNVVQPRRYNGRLIDEDLTHAVLAFIAFYIGAVSVGALLLTMTGLDLVTALSGAAAAIGNVGPGLGDVVGPGGTYASLSDLAKWILSGLMLLGRLELFALLVLFDPRFWRR
jgi:trk system potassium uptake protein TrkH